MISGNLSLPLSLALILQCAFNMPAPAYRALSLFPPPTSRPDSAAPAGRAVIQLLGLAALAGLLVGSATAGLGLGHPGARLIAHSRAL